MASIALTTSSAQLLHRASDGGDLYRGPGDTYRFIVTGEQTGGAYFVMEAIVPPGGGPPPHIHRNEDETFYVVEGACDFQLGDEIVTGHVGDFINIPRGRLHRFHNSGSAPARLILTFTPANMEHFFEETLERVTDSSVPPIDDIDEVAARYVAAAPRYGLEFVV